MSQDLCELFFSPIDTKIKLPKVQRAIEGIFKKHGVSIANISSGNHKKGKVVQFESNGMMEVVKESLELIYSFSNRDVPYARYYLDQAGETFFYGLINGELTEFSKLSDLEKYLAKNKPMSPEECFFTTYNEFPNLLLVRIKTPTKKFPKQLNELCQQYIQNSTNENFEILKNFINSSAPEKTINFPSLIPHSASYSGKCDQRIAESLVYSEISDGYVFLGFNSDEIELSAWENTTESDHDVLYMVAALAYCKGIKDSRAKIWSRNVSPEDEWYIYSVPSATKMCFESAKSPVDLWTG